MANFYNPSSLSLHEEISKDEKRGYFLKDRFEQESELVFDVEENTSLDLTLVDFSSQDVNVHILANLKRNSSVNIQVASLCSQKYQKHFQVDVIHVQGDSLSRTKMAGINAGEGKLFFLGNSTIVNGAHRSDTRQEGKITNLNPLAKSEVSPSLLIKENDVKASHGAAVGAYNESELFYLMSRGLSLEESKKLITYGSLLPIIESLGDEKLVEEAKNSMGELSL